MGEIKIGRDEHHREQQHDGVVVYRAISALGRHDTSRNHQHCSKQSGGGAIQWQDFELSAANENVSDPKDHARDELLFPMIHTRPYPNDPAFQNELSVELKCTRLSLACSDSGASDRF